MVETNWLSTATHCARLLIGGIAVLVGLSGCSATFRGEPEATLKPGRDLTRLVIDTTLDSDRIRNFVKCSSVDSFTTTNADGGQVTISCSGQPNDRKMYRNEIIFAQMAEITELYNVYERRISRELRESSFLFSVVQIALGTAGALSSESASQAFSAANAALTGVDQAFTKDVLVESTIQAFQEQMRARRDAVKARILLNTQIDMTAYPLQAAIADLSEFRQAGTLTGALLGIAADSSSSRATQSEEVRKAEKVLRAPASVSATSIKILAWINEKGLTKAEKNVRRGSLRKCFSSYKTSDPKKKPSEFADFLTESKKYPELEAAIVACMKTALGVNFVSLK